MEVFRVFATLGLNSQEFEGGLDNAQSRMQDLGGSMQAVGGDLTKHVTLPIVAIGAAALAAGNDVDQAMNTIRRGTGATGESLDELMDSFRNVARGVPNNLGEVSTAIADLNTRLGLTGEPLEAMATQMLNLARITGTDVSTVIRETTRLFGDWGVETSEQAQTLDELWKVSQATGIGVTDLAGQMVQFGAPLRALGFEFGESAAMLAQWEQQGVNANLVLGGMKQGINSLSAEAAESGKSLSEAFSDVVNSIQNASTEQEAFAIASDTFGVRAATDLMMAIREGRLSIDDLLATLEASPETILAAADDTRSLGDTFSQLKNEATLALAPIGVRLIEAIQGAMPLVSGFLDKVAGLVEWFVALPEPMQTTIGVLAGLLAAAGPVLTVVGGLVRTFGNLAPLLSAAPGILTAVKGAFLVLSGPVGIIVGLIAALVAAFMTDFLGIRTAVMDQLSRFGEAFSRWGDIISSGIEAAKGVFRAFGDWSGTFFRSLPERFRGFGRDIVTGLRDGITGMFDSIRSTISDLAEGVTGWFKNLLGIESPSTVFYGYGLDITQGLADGIDAGTPTAAAAAARLGEAVATTMKAIVRGAMTPENLLGGIGKGMGAADAKRDIQARLDELRDQQFTWNTRAGLTPGTRGYVNNVIDAQIAALEDELKRLNQTLRDTSSENARALDNQAKRFGLSVDAFANATSRQALVALRYA